MDEGVGREEASGRTRLKVAMFCGGRGAGAIVTAFLRHPRVELTLLINAYDDGLSTGFLRRYIPGMLGPSDVRKNVSRAMPEGGQHHQALKRLLEHRFRKGTTRQDAMADLEAILDDGRRPGRDPLLGEVYPRLSVGQLREIQGFIAAFVRYEGERHASGFPFEYEDCSLGNILFAGCYLANDRDFNRTVSAFGRFAESRARVLNVTDGEALVLTAVTSRGEFLADEASIVSSAGFRSVRELFLLPPHRPGELVGELAELSPEAKIARLRQEEVIPRPNPEALAALSQADLIIYGPGTQNSSLFPSYLTEGVYEAIAGNREAEAAFIGNLARDHDILGESIQYLLRSLCTCMGRKRRPVELGEVVTRVLIQDQDRDEVNSAPNPDRVPFDRGAIGLDPEAVVILDWADDEKIRHQGGLLVEELLGTVRQMVDFRIQPPRHMISIVVPVLNEARHLNGVLRDLGRLDFSPYHLSKEIVLVDGGSSDGTLEIAKQWRYVRSYSLGMGSGRGEVIRFGLSKARGDIIALFPGDGEYDARDLIKVALPIVENQYQAVFGSRLIRCIHSDQIHRILKQVYGGSRIQPLISRVGGFLTSFLCLVLYNRYVSDLYSTIKAFDGNLVRSMRLTARGVGLESEFIAELSRRHLFVLEVPVGYVPRTRSQGKKIGMLDGLSVLWGLLRYRFRFDKGPAAPWSVPSFRDED
ncbi:MAG: YvcK family protein [Magnetococcales bacterium]|nr:YvcK family protein [Magnetococcales bacterium]